MWPDSNGSQVQGSSVLTPAISCHCSACCMFPIICIHCWKLTAMLRYVGFRQFGVLRNSRNGSNKPRPLPLSTKQHNSHLAGHRTGAADIEEWHREGLLFLGRLRRTNQRSCILSGQQVAAIVDFCQEKSERHSIL